jgi:hypothetical protein
MPITYKRALLFSRHPGKWLPTQDEARLGAMAIEAKLARIAATSMPWRMRLAAMTAADNRQGQCLPA